MPRMWLLRVRPDLWSWGWILMDDIPMTGNYPSEGWLYIPCSNEELGAILLDNWVEEPPLNKMQSCVGGLIEYVPLGREARDFVMPLGKLGHVEEIVVNEEGLLIGLDFNPVATAIANRTHGFNGFLKGPHHLVGPALIKYRTNGDYASIDLFNEMLGGVAVFTVTDEMGSSTLKSFDGEITIENPPNQHFAACAEGDLPDYEEEE